MNPPRRSGWIAALALTLAIPSIAQTGDRPSGRIDGLEREVAGGTATASQQLELAQQYIESERYWEASQLAERMLAANPGDAEAKAALAQAREGLGRIQQQRLAAAEARGLAPGASAEDRLALADAYFSAGRYHSAAAIYADLPEGARSRDVRLRHARALSWGGRMWDAEAVYAALLREGSDPALELEYGRLLSWMGASRAARERLAAIYERDGSEEALLALANAMAWSGSRTEAIELLDRHLASHPAATAAAELRAELNEGPALRLERVERLIAVEPYNLALATERARLLHEAGRQGEALRAIEEIRERRGSNEVEGLAELERAAREARERELEQARARLAAMEGATPATPEQTLELAHAFEGAGDHDEAIRLYRSYLDQRPDDEAARIEYARVLTWDGRYDPARREYRRLLELHPDRADLKLEYAKVLSWDSDFTAAVREFRDLTDLSDNPRAHLYEEVPAEAYSRLGQIYRWFGWHDTAAEYQASALSLDSTFPLARQELDMVRGLRPSTNLEGRFSNVENSSEFQARMFDLRGTHWTSRRTAIEGWLGRHEFTDRAGTVEANVLGVGGRYRFEDRLTGFARLGVTDYSDGIGTRPFWTIGAEHLPSLQSRVAAEYSRYDLVYDVHTLESLEQPVARVDDPIWIDDFRAHWDYDTGGRLLYLADASYGAISDDNSRAAAHGLVTFRLLKSPFVALKADGRWLSYDFRSSRYWSPEDYTSLAGVLQVGHNWRERLYFQAELKYGNSWEEGRDSRDFRSIGGSVTVPLNDRFDVIGSYIEGESGRLPQILPGDEHVSYWQRTWYVGVRVKRLFQDDERDGRNPWYYDERPLQSSPVIPPLGERP